MGFIKLFNIINVHHFNNTKRNEAKINGRWENVCAWWNEVQHRISHPFARGGCLREGGGGNVVCAAHTWVGFRFTVQGDTMSVRGT